LDKINNIEKIFFFTIYIFRIY